MESNVRIELQFDGKMSFKISVTENSTQEELVRVLKQCEDTAEYLCEKYHLLDALIRVNEGV